MPYLMLNLDNEERSIDIDRALVLEKARVTTMTTAHFIQKARRALVPMRKATLDAFLLTMLTVACLSRACIITWQDVQISDVRGNGVPSKGSRISQGYNKAWYDSYSHHKRPHDS
jgi:hypothetical protein